MGVGRGGWSLNSEGIVERSILEPQSIVYIPSLMLQCTLAHLVDYCRLMKKHRHRCLWPPIRSPEKTSASTHSTHSSTTASNIIIPYWIRKHGVHFDLDPSRMMHLEPIMFFIPCLFSSRVFRIQFINYPIWFPQCSDKYSDFSMGSDRSVLTCAL